MAYSKQEMLNELINEFDATPSYAEKAVERWFGEKSNGTTLDGDLEVDTEKLYDSQEYWD